MTDMDREHLIGNIVAHLSNANKDIQLRQAQIFYKADTEYGQRVAEGLGIKLQKNVQDK
jgi:catalase